MSQDKVAEALHRHQGLLQDTVDRHGGDLEQLAARLVEVFHEGGRLLTLGSGPFGQVANLVAGFFMHRLGLDRPLLPALSLSHDALLASALISEDDADQYFARQLRALGVRGDVVLAFADGRREKAIEEAFSLARQNECLTAVIFRGKEEDLPDVRPDFLVRIETDASAGALEVALFCGKTLCELVESELFGL